MPLSSLWGPSLGAGAQDGTLPRFLIPVDPRNSFAALKQALPGRSFEVLHRRRSRLHGRVQFGQNVSPGLRPVGLRRALQLRIEGQWQTIRLFDNAHGDHDMHRYTGSEKQPAERFSEGAPNEVAPEAIRHLIDHWEAIAEAWKS